MRRYLAFALMLPVLALTAAGCGEKEQAPTPVACLAAPAAWLASLSSAPDQVLIDDSTPISDCLPKDQAAAQQEEVGRTATEVATDISTRIKSGGPGSVAWAARAGYLVGALEKGAEQTEGIHATLVDRVEAAATNGIEGAAPAARAAYRRGRAAGRESG